VDKKSFIRWKQRDIHEKRAQRKQEMEDLTLSNKVNKTLLTQIDGIIAKLASAPDTVDEANIARAFAVDEANLGNAPTGPNGPSYREMLTSLFAECKKATGKDENKKEAYVRELGVHKKKIEDSIAKNAKELEKLEKEERNKITSEGLHEGFSSSVRALCIWS